MLQGDGCSVVAYGDFDERGTKEDGYVVVLFFFFFFFVIEGGEAEELRLMLYT